METMEGAVLMGELDQAKKKTRVLVAIDDSEGSTYALRWALDNLFPNAGKEDRLVVMLLHVQQPFQPFLFPAAPAAVYVPPSTMDSIKKAQDENSKLLLSRALQICKEKSVSAETLIMDGEPKDMICQAAEQMQVDFVIVGSRGLSKIKRVFLGSVSDYVAHHATCPVLIVKPKKQVDRSGAQGTK